jgi:2-amino-4-hydroxy-6-hydroxymethyldihydropteridine diphosphokinase
MLQIRSVVVGLGSNLGGRESLLRAAVDLLANTEEIKLVAHSSLYDSMPIGPAQPRFLNAAVHVETSLAPEEILQATRSVETTLGRERRERWGPRTLDLDVLWIQGVVHDSECLHVPHGELTKREFALCPLVEVVSDAVDVRDGVLLQTKISSLQRDASLCVSPFPSSFSTEILDHTADEGFVVTARDRADLLAAAAEALGSIVVNPESVAITRHIEVSLHIDDEASDEERMFTWLCEVLHHLDARRLALRRVAILEDSSTVRAVLLGDDLSEATHDVRSAIKAITWHTLEVTADSQGIWRAQVVVDI